MSDPPKQLTESHYQDLIAQRVLDLVRREQEANRRETDQELITLRVLDVIRRERDADRRQQEAARRWRIGIIATIMGALGTALVAVWLETGRVGQDAIREAAENSANRLISIFSGEDAVDDIMTISPGEVQPVTLAEDEQRRFRLAIPAAGLYRIDAIAVTDGFDPFLYLYKRSDEEDMELELLMVDDDGLGDFNARIEASLEQTGDYYADVEELVGSAGTVNVAFSLAQ